MRFTLTYRGPLPASGSAKQKHDLRRALHPQLKELWHHEPLRDHRDKWINPQPAGDSESGRALCTTGNHAFVVLVKNDFRFVAELDVLILRPEPPGKILQGADIDNRLKTLFDALRYPDNTQELPPTWVPNIGENPLYCLLEDDGLITRVNVDTDRLLDPTAPDEAALTVRVQVRARTPSYASMELLS